VYCSLHAYLKTEFHKKCLEIFRQTRDKNKKTPAHYVAPFAPLLGAISTEFFSEFRR